MADLIVGDLTPRNQYTATSGQTDFTYAFPIFTDADLKVYVGTTLKTLTTDYTVSGAGTDNGGTVTLVTGATTGDIVTVYRDMPVQRTSDYQTNGDLLASTLNDDLDKLAMMIQQVEYDLNNRCLRFGQFTTGIPLSEFTESDTDRAGKVLGFDSLGNPNITQELGVFKGSDATTTTANYVLRDIVKDSSNSNVYICTQTSTSGTLLTNTSYWALLIDAAAADSSAAAAAASAAAALVSEGLADADATATAADAATASTAATNALASETAAASSASSASTSASTATTQATSASTSATNAASSASAASASESAADTSATSASGSATTATTQANAASTSATAAASSATTASNSATTATTKASEASTSATNAATSATNAATSETNAATSETNAATSAANAAASEAATADKLPLAGGTMTGDVSLGDNVKANFGASDDLQIYHDGSNSWISELGTGDLRLGAVNIRIGDNTSGASYIYATQNGAVDIYHNSSKKLATTSTGIDVTGRAVVDSSNCVTVVDNDGSFDMNGGNNFKCTPTGAITLTFTNITDGQSGFILLVNTGGHTVSAAATTKVDANALATISTAGTYLVSYFSDGTNVYLTNSAVYA